jgi:hypothetical protein
MMENLPMMVALLPAARGMVLIVGEVNRLYRIVMVGAMEEICLVIQNRCKPGEPTVDQADGFAQ